jgi:hypothetical protein
MTATQTEFPLPHQVLSTMYAKFLADVDEYDTDQHRTITPSPEGPLITMSTEVLWFFNQWACLKYGAYPEMSPWQQVAERVLHSTEPVVLACGCFVEPGDPHPKEDCFPALNADIAVPKGGSDAWIWRLYAKQQSPETLAAERFSQIQQGQDAFVALVVRFAQVNAQARAQLRWSQPTQGCEAIEAWLGDWWGAFRHWVRSQDDMHGTKHLMVSHHVSRMEQDPARKRATSEALGRALRGEPHDCSQPCDLDRRS